METVCVCFQFNCFETFFCFGLLLLLVLLLLLPSLPHCVDVPTWYIHICVCCVSVVHNGCVFWVRLWSFVYRMKMMTRALCFCLWAQLLSSHITTWVEITNTIACWSGAVGAIQCVCQLEEKERKNKTKSTKRCNSNRQQVHQLQSNNVSFHCSKRFLCARVCLLNRIQII